MELLVVIAILGALVALGTGAYQTSLRKSKQAGCAGNMRNIAVAMTLYAQENNGRLPETTHTASIQNAWIYQLEEHIGKFDETRVCPADPKKAARLAARGSSYILNSFVFVPQHDAFGSPIGRPMNNLYAIEEPSRTLMCVVCADSVGVAPGNDHTHSEMWNSWAAVRRDVATDRHGTPTPEGTKGGSNYLYFCGRVAYIEGAKLREMIARGENPAQPPGLKL